jgi:AraC-like DNA-binding protein
MKLSSFDLFVILGVAQGLYTALLLLFTPGKRLQNRLLAAILLTFLLLSCKILLHTLGVWNTSLFRYFPLAIDLLLQPLIYLYVRAVARPEKGFKSIDWLHFFPVALFLLHAVVVYVNVLPETSMSKKDTIANGLFFNDLKLFEDYLSVISAWVYGVLSYQTLQTYRRLLHDNISDVRYAANTWLRNVLVLFGILVLMLTVNIIADRSGLMLFGFYHWQLFYIAIAIIVYYMGFQGYNMRAMPNAVLPHTPKPASGLLYSEGTVEQTRQKITTALQDHKIYRDATLSLVKLADEIQVPVALVSCTINTTMKMNFRNLVNSYRVEEMKARLHDPNLKHLSILGLALDCGFNSEASFYRIFKNVTGMTPKEFMANSQ